MFCDFVISVMSALSVSTQLWGFNFLNKPTETKLVFCSIRINEIILTNSCQQTCGLFLVFHHFRQTEKCSCVWICISISIEYMPISKNAFIKILYILPNCPGTAVKEVANSICSRDSHLGLRELWIWSECLNYSGRKISIFIFSNLWNLAFSC